MPSRLTSSRRLPDGVLNVYVIAFRGIVASLLLVLPFVIAGAQPPLRPVPLIFDTDIGNDCDDVLALGMVHALESRGECKLLAVTITKDHPWAAPFVDGVNTFYGRPDVPIGVCHSGVTPAAGNFNGLANIVDDGQLRYPHDLMSGAAALDAVKLLRQKLAAADDQSVVICQVGFFTNMANLLESPADEISPLTGKELVKRKVRLLSLMAGSFADIPQLTTSKRKHFGEYNVVKDLAAAQKVAEEWPTPILWSGYEIGYALKYPYRSILEDYNYAAHHPAVESYDLFAKPPHDRPTWDLTSVLYPVRPNHGYFELSPPGAVTIDENGYTHFAETPQGRDRFLILPVARRTKTLEALTLLSSEPPNSSPD